MTVKFGIIGLGMISRFHARAIAATPGAELIAVLSRDLAKATRFADEFHAVPYTNLDEFLDHVGLDAISICTPSGHHLEPCTAGAKAGKHVVCEKPLEINTSRIDQMISICKKSDVLLSGIFPRRFNPATRILKDAIKDKRFGEVNMADAYIKWWRSQDYYDSGDWRGTWKLDGGGALMNQSIHTIDLLLYLMGPIKNVRAETRLRGHTAIEVEDTAVALCEFEGGALGVIQGSTASWSKTGHSAEIQITGSRGSVFMADDYFKVWEFDDETEADEIIRKEFMDQSSRGGAGAADPSAIDFSWHTRNYEDIVAAIVKKGKPKITGEEARRAVALIAAIYESAASGGKRVEVS